LWLVLLLTVVAALAAEAVGASSVEAGPDTPDIYIEVAGAADCTTNRQPPPQGPGDARCSVAVGRSFTVRGYVSSIAGLPDLNQDTSAGYAGLQFRLVYSDGLIVEDRPGDTELGPPGQPYWPDCSLPLGGTMPGSVQHGCLVEGASSSTFLGKVLEVGFNCAVAGQQAITLANAFSYVHDEFHGSAAEGDGDEVLTIDCVAGSDEPSEPDPAAPDPSLLQPAQPDGEGLPTAGSGPAEGNGGSGLILGLAAGVVAVAAAVIGGGILLARRSRVE